MDDGSNNDVIKRPSYISRMKIKSEPFDEVEGVHEGLNDDVMERALASFTGQNELTRSDLNESENPNVDGSVFQLKVEGIIIFF